MSDSSDDDVVAAALASGAAGTAFFDAAAGLLGRRGRVRLLVYLQRALEAQHVAITRARLSSPRSGGQFKFPICRRSRGWLSW